MKKLTSNEVAALVSEKAFKFYSDTDPLSVYQRISHGESVYDICGKDHNDRICMNLHTNYGVSYCLESMADEVSK